jgi:hypothetical protein
MKACTFAILLLTATMAFAQVASPSRALIFRAGYDNGPVLVNLQLRDQHRLFSVPTIGIVQYVIWQCDAGASNFQLASRHAGNVKVITPVMVPSTFGTVSGTIACVSNDGNPRQWEGNQVPCSSIGNIGIANGDTFETTDNPTADGISKSCTAVAVVQ